MCNKLKDNPIHTVFAMNLQEIPDYRHLLPYVAERSRRRVSSLRHQEDALQILAGEMMIRALAGWKLNREYRYVNFVFNPYGKPALANAAGFFFNLSHSGTWVVGAVGPSELGIDIQKVEPIDLHIGHHIFVDRELQALEQAGSSRLDCFFELWTRKESYLKMLGLGLAKELNTFGVDKDEGGRYQVYSSEGLGDCVFRQYDIDPAYKLAACALTGDFADDIVVLSWDSVWRASQPV